MRPKTAPDRDPRSSVIASSQQLAVAMRNAFLAGTGEPVSSDDSTDGIEPRDDLGGLNLTTVPKVPIERCPMRSPFR